MSKKLIVLAAIAIFGLTLESRAQDCNSCNTDNTSFFATANEELIYDNAEFTSHSSGGDCNLDCDCQCDEYCWRGFYLGGHFGGAWDEVSYGAGSATQPGTPDLPFNGDAFAGGALIGFNLQRCDIVYGLEADISYGDFKGANPTRSVLDFDIKTTGTLRGRVGYARDRLLLFGTAGIGFADVESHETGGVDAKDHVGIVAGAGCEWALTKHLRLRAEYLYSSYSTETYNFPLAVPHSHRVGFETNAVRGAIIFGF